MSTKDRIRDRLSEALRPQGLDIDDESGRHAGHAGARPGGETHFRVVIVAEVFEGMSRLERQRMVVDLLDAEFANGLHALSLSARTPSEVAADKTHTNACN